MGPPASLMRAILPSSLALTLVVPDQQFRKMNIAKGGPPHISLCKRWRSAMTRHVSQKTLALGFVAVASTGCCCSSLPITDRFYAPQELSGLVTGRTMRIGDASGSDMFALLYLAPDGTGWLDTEVLPGEPPKPSAMSMLANWRLEGGSQICAWASPRIGEMPSFVPSHLMCIRLLRPDIQNPGITAVTLRNGWYQVLPLEFYPFNAFSIAAIEQYRRQVRVLYGGQIPDWSPL
jgi:hypothetical protein